MKYSFFSWWQSVTTRNETIAAEVYIVVPLLRVCIQVVSPSQLKDVFEEESRVFLQ